MKKTVFNKRATALVFTQFSRKSYSLFSCLGKVVLIGTLSVPTLTYAKANGISTHTEKVDSSEQHVDKVVALGDVEITGSRAPLALGQAARMVTVLDSAKIAQAPVQSINDLLKYATGVDVRQRGPIGAQTDIGIRGGTHEQVAILLNGINICDPQTGHNAFDFPTDISEIERIEIIQGPAGRIIGTSSLVGAINIVTKPRKQSGAEAYLETGSYGYLRSGAVVSLSKQQKKGSLLSNQLSGSYARSDGYSRNEEGQLNMDFKGGKAFWQGCFEDDWLQLRWHAGLSIKSFGSNTFYSANYDNQFERTGKWFSALYAETKKGWFHFRPQVYWNHSTDRFELIRNQPEKVPYNYNRSDVIGVNMNGWFDWALGRTAVGAELRNEDLVSGNLGEALSHPKHIHGTDRYYEYGINRTNISFHLEHNILLRNFTLSAGVIAVKNSWNEMNFQFYPGADASYRIGSHWKVYASWNTSLRMPSATELYYNSKGYKPNPYLEPEELSAAEVGLKHASRGIEANLSVYHHHYSNMVDWVRSSEEGYTWECVNYTKVNAWGAEVGVKLDFGTLLAGQKLLETLDLSYQRIDQHKKHYDDYVRQSMQEYLRHKFVAGLCVRLMESRNLGNMHLSLHYRFQDRAGSYTSRAGETCDYKPYGLVDARLSWDKTRLNIYAQANNLTNYKDYVDYGNVPQPGIWFTVGAKWKIF